MENQTQNKKFDLGKLGKLQKSYFDASVANVLEANQAIKAAQNWLLILGLAEMSFLGALLLQDNDQHLYIRIILSVLLVSFILFIIGSVKQYRHLLSSARYYEKLSNMVLTEIERVDQCVNKIPDEIKVEKNQIKSDKVTNILIYSSLVLILLSTVALILYIKPWSTNLNYREKFTMGQKIN